MAWKKVQQIASMLSLVLGGYSAGRDLLYLGPHSQSIVRLTLYFQCKGLSVRPDTCQDCCLTSNIPIFCRLLVQTVLCHLTVLSVKTRVQASLHLPKRYREQMTVMA